MFILRALLNTGCLQLPVGALPMRLLWQLATLFTERHPSLRFQLFALSSDQILGRLNQNQFDVGIPILSVSTRRISRACRWVQHGCCTTGVTFAFQVPVTWEGAGEASARHVVERHAFSAITRSHVAQSRLESRPGLETDAVCRLWNTASVRAQSKHHPLPLDLLTETTSRDGQTPDLILQTLRCARLCLSVRATFHGSGSRMEKLWKVALSDDGVDRKGAWFQSSRLRHPVGQADARPIHRYRLAASVKQAIHRRPNS